MEIVIKWCARVVKFEKEPNNKLNYKEVLLNLTRVEGTKKAPLVVAYNQKVTCDHQWGLNCGKKLSENVLPAILPPFFFPPCCGRHKKDGGYERIRPQKKWVTGSTYCSSF